MGSIFRKSSSYETFKSFDHRYVEYGKKLLPSMYEFLLKQRYLDEDQTALILYFVIEGIQEGNLDHVFGKQVRYGSTRNFERDFFSKIHEREEDIKKIVSGFTFFVSFLRGELLQLVETGGEYQVRFRTR